MLGRMFVWLMSESLLLFGAVVFLLLAVATELGFRLGRWRATRRRPEEKELSSVGAVTTGMIGLLAFSLGLTISFAQSRFEVRRNLVTQEANTIGTAWLRARLIGDERGLQTAALIEDYAKVRLAYTVADALDQEPQLLAHTGTLQNRIWESVQVLGRERPTPVTALLIAAVNDMFDSSLEQRFAFDSRVPANISWVLLDGALLTVGAIGYHLGLVGKRQAALMALLLVMWSGGLVLIVDLNRPRIGSIRVDPAPLMWTIQSFQSPPALR